MLRDSAMPQCRYRTPKCTSRTSIKKQLYFKWESLKFEKEPKSFVHSVPWLWKRRFKNGLFKNISKEKSNGVWKNGLKTDLHGAKRTGSSTLSEQNVFWVKKMRLDEPRGHEKTLRRQFLLLMATLSDFTQKKSSYPSTTKLTESMAIQFISFACLDIVIFALELSSLSREGGDIWLFITLVPK